MAILKFGTLVVGARGTIGGATLSANKSGPYAKSWARPGNQRTPNQSNQRAALGTFASNWKQITASQRADWDAYAADPAQELTNSLGEAYYVSGFNWFVGINSNLLEAGQPQRDDAPTIETPSAPTITAAYFKTAAAATESRIELDTSNPWIEGYHHVTARVFFSAGIISGYSKLARIADLIPSGSTPASMSYTAAASTATASPASNVNDGNLTTSWLTAWAGGPQWIQGTFASPTRRVTSYRLYNIVGTPAASSPQDWTLEYWDGATFQTIDTQSGISMNGGQWYDYALATPQSILSDIWRVNITNNHAGAFVGLVEMEFLGFDPTTAATLQLQDEIIAKFGDPQLGQQIFYGVQAQNAHGRRGPVATIAADAEAT